VVVGKCLRQFREEKHLSQADIEKRCGLFRAYVARVEGGHTVPSLKILERWAKALGIELYQLLFVGDAQPRAPQTEPSTTLGREQTGLLEAFNRLGPEDQRLLLFLARSLWKKASARR